jgi:SNF2 family DNA or RNA helicase
MIRLFFKDEEIGIKISGPNFDDLKEVVKDYGFHFKPNWGWHDHLWVSPKSNSIKRALFDLNRIEPLEISLDLLEKISPKKETEYFRIKLDESLLKSPPKGEYQLEGIRQGIRQSRLMYAWEMGLGKTYAVISVINHLWANNLADRVLVLCPTESLVNFRLEFLRFNSFGLTEDDFYTASASNREPFQPNHKIVILTYNTFRVLSDDRYKKSKGKKAPKGKKVPAYRTPQFDLSDWGTNRVLVADESHMLKNWAAKQTKIVRMEKKYFRFRYMLSGTPYPNGPHELYSQLTILDEGIIGESYNNWLASVANLGNEYSDYAVASWKPDSVKEFIKNSKPWMIREFTEGNIELPDRIMKKNFYDLSPKQLSIYQLLISYQLSIIKEEKGTIRTREVENKFPFMIQAVEDPCRLKGKIDQMRSPNLWKAVDRWKFEDNSKLPICTSLLDRNISEGHKTILWSGHPTTMDSLAEFYRRYKPIVIHGQIKVPKGTDSGVHRNNLLETFKNDPKHNLLIASYKVLSVAVNIVQSRRSIYFDRSFDLKEWLQSIKRSHRIGQTEMVLVNSLIGYRTLEMRLDRKLERKTATNDNLLAVDSLPPDEWVKIFEGEEAYE